MKIEEKIKKAIPKSNLTKNETDALKQLSQRDDIIITKADKGGEVVIIDNNSITQISIRKYHMTQQNPIEIKWIIQ